MLSCLQHNRVFAFERPIAPLNLCTMLISWCAVPSSIITPHPSSSSFQASTHGHEDVKQAASSPDNDLHNTFPPFQLARQAHDVAAVLCTKEALLFWLYCMFALSLTVLHLVPGLVKPAIYFMPTCCCKPKIGHYSTAKWFERPFPF